MIGDTHPAAGSRHEPSLGEDFTKRLELSLDRADHRRRIHQIASRARRYLLVGLLVAPIVAWRLMIASPGGLHTGIDALTWLAFVIDVGVHMDTQILAYLHMQALPTVAGALLLILVPGSLLLDHSPRK